MGLRPVVIIPWLWHSDYVEIGLVADYTLFGVLDFNLCATLGT